MKFISQAEHNLPGEARVMLAGKCLLGLSHPLTANIIITSTRRGSKRESKVGIGSRYREIINCLGRIPDTIFSIALFLQFIETFNF